MSSRLAALLALALTAGCNEGGIMELELLLPTAPDAYDVGPCASCPDEPGHACEGERCVYRGPWFSQVEISSEFTFLDPSSGLVNQWDLGTEASADPVPLPVAGRRAHYNCTSVLGDRTIDTVRVRLKYCRNETCAESLSGDSIEHWYEIEQPFYDGRRTHVRRRAPTLPDAATSCVMDSDCAGAPEGATCLPSTGRCGCVSDSECGDGHCEGAGTSTGESRCTLDVDRCRVTGCISVEDLLVPSPICFGDGETHPCEDGPTIEYRAVDCVPQSD